MEPSAPQSTQEIGLRRRAGLKICRRCVCIRPVNQQTRTVVVPTRGLKWTLNSSLRLLVPREYSCEQTGLDLIFNTSSTATLRVGWC